MKNNKKLFAVIIALVALLMLMTGLLMFLSIDPSKNIKNAFKALNQESFKSMSLTIKDGEDIVFKDKDGKIENPLDLEYAKEDYLNINFDYKKIKGPKRQNGDVISVTGEVKDSLAFLGKQVENLKVSYEVDIAKEEVLTIGLVYEENGYSVEIVMYKQLGVRNDCK